VTALLPGICNTRSELCFPGVDTQSRCFSIYTIDDL
jgi:hypothetical protein